MKPIFEVAGIHVPAYSLMLSVGACLFVWVSVRSARKRELPRQRLPLVLIAAYVSALVGARMFFALERTGDAPSETELSITALFGGYVSHGAFVGGIAALAAGALWMRINFLTLADTLSPGICWLGAAGRLGCFLAGCCYGRPTETTVGVVFPHGSSVAMRFGPEAPVHPSQIYDMAAWMVTLLVVWLAARRRESVPAGAAFSLLVVTYSIARFAVELTRGDHQIVYAGLHLAQWYSLVAILLTTSLFWFHRRPAPQGGPALGNRAVKG